VLHVKDGKYYGEGVFWL